MWRDEGWLWKGRGAEKDGWEVTGKDEGIVKWEDSVMEVMGKKGDGEGGQEIH